MIQRTQELYDELIKIITPDTVFACIGAVKTTSYVDSIGPQVGDLLKAAGLPFVYGCTEKPYNGITAETMAETIYKFHPYSTIIAIDTCCTSYEERLYKILIEQGYIAPGAGVNKKLTRIGDYCIKAYMISTDNMDLIYNNVLLKSKEYDTIMATINESITIIANSIIRAHKYVMEQPILDVITNNESKYIYRMI